MIWKCKNTIFYIRTIIFKKDDFFCVVFDARKDGFITWPDIFFRQLFKISRDATNRVSTKYWFIIN